MAESQASTGSAATAPLAVAVRMPDGAQHRLTVAGADDMEMLHAQVASLCKAPMPAGATLELQMVRREGGPGRVTLPTTGTVAEAGIRASVMLWCTVTAPPAAPASPARPPPPPPSKAPGSSSRHHKGTAATAVHDDEEVEVVGAPPSRGGAAPGGGEMVVRYGGGDDDFVVDGSGGSDSNSVVGMGGGGGGGGGGGRRPVRASALSARTNMQEMAAEQDRLARSGIVGAKGAGRSSSRGGGGGGGGGSSGGAKRGGAATSSPSKPAVGYGIIASLGGSSGAGVKRGNSASTGAPAKRGRPAGATTGVGRPPRRRGGKKAAGMVQDPAGDARDALAMRLASSFRGGGGGDPLMEYFRAAARGALVAQYEVTRATAREAAARAGSWDMAAAAGGGHVLGSGAVAAVAVSFAAGARVRESEVVDNIPRAAAVAVLRAIVGGTDAAARELVRPAVAAAVSPRQFWAWVRYGAAALRGGSRDAPLPARGGGDLLDLDAAWRALAPDCDWRFLTTRPRKLTEKGAAAALAATAAAGEAAARAARRSGLVASDSGDSGGIIDIEADAPATAGADGGAAAAAAVAEAIAKARGPSTAALDVLHIAAALEPCAALEGSPLDSVIPPVGSGAVRARVDAELPGLLAFLGSLVSGKPAAGGAAAGGAAASPAEAGAGMSAAVALAGYASLDGLMDAAAKVADVTPWLSRAAGVFQGPDVDDGGSDDGLERDILFCDECARWRHISERDTDLEAARSREPWTCAAAGVARLTARGGCSAPDDELTTVVAGGEAAAAAATVLGLTSVPGLASAAVPDDDVMLYRGPEGVVPGTYLADAHLRAPCGATYRTVRVADDTDVAAWQAVLAPRQVPLRFLGAGVGTIATTPPPPSAPSCCGYTRPADLRYRLLGRKAVAAGLLALALDRAVGMNPDAYAGVPAAQAAAAVWRLQGPTIVAALATPVGWAAGAAVARVWVTAARSRFVSEVMEGALTKCADLDGDAVAAVLDALGELGLGTPADLLRNDAGDVVTAVARHLAAAHARDGGVPAAVLPAHVAVWQAEAAAAIQKEPWLADVVTGY